MKIAAIDIGSNALRLIIKDTEQQNFLYKLDNLGANDYYERVPLKSGMDVFDKGEILPQTKIKLTLALQHFAKIMREHGVICDEHGVICDKHDIKTYRAVATSAYRDAKNGKEVISAAGKASGLNVEIISGNEEARLTHLSFIPPKQWAKDYFLFVDVGGGSTEISLLHEGNLLYSHSFQVGSMRYLCGKQDNAQIEALDAKIADIFRQHAPLHYIATGGCVKFMNNYLNQGTPSAAAGVDSRNGKDKCGLVAVSRMQAVYQDLKKKTVSQIVDDYNLPAERADILTPASSIFLRIAKGLEAEEIIVPAIGVRNGILAELYLGMQTAQ